MRKKKNFIYMNLFKERRREKGRQRKRKKLILNLAKTQQIFDKHLDNYVQN